MKKEYVSMLRNKEMFDQLSAWTKARLGGGGRGHEEDELLEASDMRQDMYNV